MPIMSDDYIHLDTTVEDFVAQADWEIPNTYCASYYFALSISTTYDATPTTYYVGGTNEAIN